MSSLLAISHFSHIPSVSTHRSYRILLYFYFHYLFNFADIFTNLRVSEFEIHRRLHSRDCIFDWRNIRSSKMTESINQHLLLSKKKRSVLVADAIHTQHLFILDDLTQTRMAMKNCRRSLCTYDSLSCLFLT